MQEGVKATDGIRGFRVLEYVKRFFDEIFVAKSTRIRKSHLSEIFGVKSTLVQKSSCKRALLKG